MKWTDYIWPVIGLAAVALSIWFLYHELRGISADDVFAGLAAIPLHRWLMAAGGAVVAYGALAVYDHLALLHIGKKVSWVFVTLCSFTTYALSHNIGGSVVSGAVIRYRAYGSRGLTMHEVGILVAFCFVTFILSAMLVGGVVFLIEPAVIERFVDFEGLPVKLSATTGALLILVVAAYVFGSWLGLKPIRIGGFHLEYPRLPLVFKQLTIGPIEIIGAAAIVYFALPEAGNPGFIPVLGVFVVAFSLATSTHAPGGIGVFEIVAIAGLSDMDTASVVAALVVFRLFYFIVPLVIAISIVIAFEREQLRRRWPFRR